MKNPLLSGVVKRKAISHPKQWDWAQSCLSDPLHKQLIFAKNYQQLKNRVISLIRPLRYSHFCFGLFPNHRNVGPFITNLPNEVMDTYYEERYFEVDFGVDYLLNAERPALRSSIGRFYRCDANGYSARRVNKHLLCFMRSHGFEDCVLIPVTGIQFSAGLAVFSDTTKRRQFHDLMIKTADRLASLARCIEFVLYRNILFAVKYGKSGERENGRCVIEALRHLSNGYENMEAVAKQMGISRSSVKADVARARDLLGASTTYEAIRLATKKGLL